MDKEMSKGKIILFMAALILSTVAVMADMVIIPIIGSWYELYWDQIGLVNFAISGPVLFMMFSSILAGKLVQYISKKTLMLVAMVLFAISSIFGVAIETITYIVIMRSIVGFSYGIIMTTGMALISEIFVDEKKRGTMLGMYNGGLSAIGVLLSIVAGYVATTSWQSVFKVYWISVPIFVIMALFIPTTPPEGTKISEESAKKESIPIISFGALCISSMVFGAIYFIIFYQIGLYVIENAIGDESLIGILSSLGTVGSFCASIIFGFTYSKLNRGVSTLIYGLLAICFLVLKTSQGVVTTAIAVTIMGFAMGNYANYYVMRATTIVPVSKISQAIGIILAVGSFGMFLSTFVSTYLQGIMGVTTITGILTVLAGIMGIGTVLSLILLIKDKQNKSSNTGSDI